MFLYEIKSRDVFVRVSANSKAAASVCPYPIAKSPNVPSAFCAVEDARPIDDDIADAVFKAEVSTSSNVVTNRLNVSSAADAACIDSVIVFVTSLNADLTPHKIAWADTNEDRRFLILTLNGV